MYNQLNNRKCFKQNRNQYQQCSGLNNKVIPSCSNIYGIDGWPASTPQQSNAIYTNGIGGFAPPNGFKQYLQKMYLYNYKGTIQLFKPHHLLEFESGITILKSGKTTYTVNDIKCVLIEDLVGTQLRLINILGIYRTNKNKMMTL
jgi:hypothetical protein